MNAAQLLLKFMLGSIRIPKGSTLKSVWKAIMRLFSSGPREARSAIEVPPTTQAPESVSKAPRAPRAKKLPSMGDLLDSLDETFKALRLPFGKLSWIPKARMVGLRKMGVHVVHPAYYDTSMMSTATVPSNRILPAMLCVSFGWSRDDSSDGIYPAVLFAIKENKLPSEVSKCAGQHYLFGAGFKVGVTSEHDVNRELFWLAGYMTVRADGSLYLHQELKPRQHTINVHNPVMRRSVGKSMTYSTKAWGKASLAQLYDEATQEKGERVCINEFAAAMNWWIAREENWSVAVRKDGERITFAIPKRLTSRFFKDRIKVTNANGETKRIIHYVRAHERATEDGKTNVKEHIRGLSEFNWKGYECRVTAPNFNGLLSTEFTIDGTVFEDGEDVPATGWIDMSKVGAILADMEDGRKFA